MIKAIYKDRNGDDVSAVMVDYNNFCNDVYNVETCRKKSGKKWITYINTINAFDIETSTIQIPIDDKTIKHEGFMYIWQACIDNDVVYYGRTWEQFQEFISILHTKYETTASRRLVIYVHNLSYEFQFMSRFFTWEKVFATKKRKVLTALTDKGIEFRCSYLLSNKSLDKFTSGSKNCKAIKQVGDLDYSIIRTPDTPLKPIEAGYCYCDVKGLCEALSDLFEADNVAKIPLTSTGYVRRECRREMKKNRHNYFLVQDTAINEKIYIMIQEAIRGGNTHGVRYNANCIINNVDSYDAASSYPFQQLTKYFPMSSFKNYPVYGCRDFERCINKFCCLFRIRFENLHIKAGVPVPYISISKCRAMCDAIKFNGRVLACSTVEMTITEIDYRLIESMYTWDSKAVKDFYVAKRGALPKELRDVIKKYYYNKCTLKHKDRYLYARSKELLNSIYGMSCTNIIHEENIYNNGEWETKHTEDIQGALDKYYNSYNTFLPYQWGLWTTAHARAHLQLMLDLSGTNTIYCDTDSDKCYGMPDGWLDEVNERIKKLDREKGAYVEYNGEEYYLGVFEKEEPYEQFKTLGAKKYAFIQDGKLGITISGVKKSGAKELKSLEDFKIGFKFKDNAGMKLWYNDDDIHSLTVNGCKIVTAANVGMEKNEYTVGLTDEFIETLGYTEEQLQKMFTTL